MTEKIVDWDVKNQNKLNQTLQSLYTLCVESIGVDHVISELFLKGQFYKMIEL